MKISKETPGYVRLIQEQTLSITVTNSSKGFGPKGIKNVAEFCRQVDLNYQEINRTMSNARKDGETTCEIGDWIFEFLSIDQFRDELEECNIKTLVRMETSEAYLPRNTKNFAPQDREFAKLFHSFRER